MKPQKTEHEKNAVLRAKVTLSTATALEQIVAKVIAKRDKKS